MADTKPSAPTPSNETPGPTLGQRIAGFFRPATPGAGAQRKPQSATSRFITGSVTFVLVAELLTFGLQYLNVQFKLHLEQPIVGPQATWFTWFFLINVITIIGLWVLLQRLGFFPRDMWAPRNGTTTARGGAASGGKAGGAGGSAGSANQIPGIGKTRTRAERRHTATVEAAKVANTKKGRFSKAKTTNTTTTTTSAKAPAATVPSTEHDGAYDRVRAAQRLRKRRAAR